MPEPADPLLEAAGQSWPVARGSNLLDALNAAGLRVPYSCRSGSCHACLVRCMRGEPLDARRHMWWNFVSSSQERIEQAKQDWVAGRFGLIPGDADEFIPLPER